MDREELPREILVHILRRLGFEDRYAAATLVCKAWRDAVTDPACWDVASVEECFERRLEVVLWSTDEFEERIDAMVKNVVDWSRGGLRELHARHCSNAALVYVASKCPRLQSLSMRDSPNLTDVAGAAIAAACPELRELDLSNTKCISLECFKPCKSLVSLKMNSPDRRRLVPLGYRALQGAAFASAMPGLEVLEFRNGALSDADLQSILDGCSKIRHLDLRGCQGLSNAAVEAASSIVPCFLKPLPRLDEPEFPRYGHWQLYSERFQPEFQF
ncbi:F-box protein SKIP1 [Selaginella moellendorffii]|uniref:F-box protein SKIP1 n=1 Tax=Selaginella moellendorffii TaxID=88036 RepID=UPI000D1C5817|nr:F-box protein SKIP1 [Selaginella moellendorffii]|eukprot:XP_024529604.1 F-box protein SKIP1 [Selaginella moellendorffii]